MQFHPSKSFFSGSLVQTFSTPLSFWEYQYNSNNTSNFVVSPCTARTSQIIAEGVVIDNLNKEDNTAKISRLSASDVSFTIKCAPIDVDALREKDVTPKAGSGNVFLANDCLVALRPIQEGEALLIDPATLEAHLFMALPEASRVKLVGFTEPSLRAFLSRELKLKVESLCPKLDVHRTNEVVGEALRAIAHVEHGEVLYEFHPSNTSVLPFATMYTMCFKSGAHYLVDKGCQCIAHSCDPNTIVDIDETTNVMKIVACKKITPGDIVSFNYLVTEWQMDAPFHCACGAPKCFGRIAGFRNLKKEDQDELLKNPKANGISPFVLALAKAARGGATDPAIPFVAPDNFSRGTIVSVTIKDSTMEAATGSSSSTSPSTAAACTCACDREHYFAHTPVDFETFGSPSSSDSATSPQPQTKEPYAARVGNTIVALRDIPKGEQVTVRKVVASSSSSSGFLDEETASTLTGHILEVTPTGAEETKKSSFSKIVASGIQVHPLIHSAGNSIEQEALQLAGNIREADAVLGRSSIFYIVDSSDMKKEDNAVLTLLVKNKNNIKKNAPPTANQE